MSRTVPPQRPTGPLRPFSAGWVPILVLDASTGFLLNRVGPDACELVASDPARFSHVTDPAILAAWRG